MQNIQVCKCILCKKQNDSIYYLTTCNDIFCDKCFQNFDLNFRCPKGCGSISKSEAKKIKKENNVCIFMEEKTNFLSQFKVFFQEIKKIANFVNEIKNSQKQMFDLMNSKFDFLSIILNDLILNNKKRSKKFKQLFEEENLNFLKTSSELYHALDEIPCLNLDYSFLENNLELLIEKAEKYDNSLMSIRRIDPKLIRKKSTLKIEDETTDVVSSRLDCVSSNRLLISAKTKAFNTIIKNDELKLFKKPDFAFPINESIELDDEKKTPTGVKSSEQSINLNFLSPEKQKRIVMENLKKEFPHYDCDLSNYIFGNKGREGQAKFLVDANWWRAWVRYINSDSKENIPSPEKIINRNLIREEHLTPQNIKYCRFILKDNLLEHHDYEAITKNVFKYLRKWYDVDYEIIRFLKKDPFIENILYLELNIDLKAQKKKRKISLSLDKTKNFNENVHSIEEVSDSKDRKPNENCIVY